MEAKINNKNPKLNKYVALEKRKASLEYSIYIFMCKLKVNY